jgi:competence protein ComGC
MRTRIVRRCTATLLFAVCAIATAEAGDPARHFPPDTAVYLGWSQLTVPDSAQAQRQELLIGHTLAIVREVSEEFEPLGLLEAIAKLAVPTRTGSVGIGVCDVELGPDTTTIHAAVVVSEVAEPALYAETMAEFAAQSSAADALKTRAIDGVTFTFMGRADPGPGLLWTVHDDRFILATSAVMARKVLACVRGAAPTLLDSEAFRFGRKRTGCAGDGRHVALFADIERVRERVKALAIQQLGEMPATVEKAIEALGLNALRSAYVEITLRERDDQMRGFLHVEGPPKGLLTLLDQAPLVDDDLRIVPRDAYWAAVQNLDLARAWREYLRVAETVSPEGAEAERERVRAMSAALGFSITDDLLPALGDTWALFDAPDHGGLLMTGSVLVAEVRDAEAVHGILVRIAEMSSGIAARSDARVRVKRTTYRGREIHYALISGWRSPVAPAWGFVDGHVILGLWPQAVAAAMQQVDPATQGASLLDQRRVAAARPALPEDLAALHYVDSPYVARMVYPLVHFAHLVALSEHGGRDAEIGLALMPPIAEATADVQAYVGGFSYEEDGVLYVGSGDGSAPATVLSTGTALAASIVVPSLLRARQITQEAVSTSYLRAIAMGVHAYRAEHDAYPPTLDALVAEGYLEQEQLYSVRNREKRIIYIRPREVDWSDADHFRVLAYEPPVSDDDERIVAAFVDGHAERVERGVFAERLRATYRELGKEDEVPAEFR